MSGDRAPAGNHYDADMPFRFRTFRVPAALTALVVAVGLLAGCSSSDSEDQTSSDATTLLQQSAEATKALTSAHLEIVVNGKIDGLPVKKLSGNLTNVPATAVTGNATITMRGSDIDIELVVIDGKLYASLSPGSWLDMGLALDIYDPSMILDPNAGLANMLANFSDPTSQGTEKVNGIETVKVTGPVSAEAVNRLVPQLKATEEMPGTAWIEKDGDHRLVQARIDDNDSSIQMTLSDWNKPVTVTKPEV